MLEKYPSEVKLVMKHFPLPSHPFAKQAAMAAMAAAAQGRFWEMHERLYAGQKELSEARVKAIAREIGLDMERFNADVEAPELWALIRKDMEEGQRAEVRGTPTAFINGKRLEARSLAGMVEAVEAALKK